MSKRLSRGIVLVLGVAVATVWLSGATSAARCGIASTYGTKFSGKPTASGEIYDPNSMTAAHPSLRFGTRVRVEDQRTGSAVVVRINNRGPFVAGRIIDLSTRAAQALGFVKRGLTRVCIRVVGG